MNTTVIWTSEKGRKKIIKNARSTKRKTNAKFNSGLQCRPGMHPSQYKVLLLFPLWPFIFVVQTALAAALLKSLYSKYKHYSSHPAFIYVSQDQSFMPLYNPSVSSDSDPMCLILPYLFLIYTFMSTDRYLMLTKSFPESMSSSVSLKLLRAE